MANRKDPERGDFWLWAAIDADTKLVLSHRVGKRDWITGWTFVRDVSERVSGPVQIATDQLPAYAGHLREHFGYEGYSYGTETKIFGEPHLPDGTLARLGHNEGVRKMVTAEREAVVGSPDLESLTTSHIERAFLTVRQELKRFQRKGLGYSKDLETHKHAVALHFGVYNFVRKHHSLGTTPAVAAGIEEKAWGLEQVVDITAAYFERKTHYSQGTYGCGEPLNAIGPNTYRLVLPPIRYGFYGVASFPLIPLQCPVDLRHSDCCRGSPP